MPKKVTLQTLLERAIRRKRMIEFTYQGLSRVCEPHVLGVANRHTQVLCWQEDGGSARGELPEWRRFDLTEIESIRTLRRTFPGPRPIPYPHSKWDSVILSVA